MPAARRNPVPQIGPEDPPDTAADGHADLLEEGADVAAVVAVPVLQDDLEPARERVPEVAVADHRVEVAEVLSSTAVWAMVVRTETRRSLSLI